MLTDEQVKLAKSRAEDVVNGFKQVANQQARDALKLAETIEEKDRQISALKRKLLADSLIHASKAGKQKVSIDDFFRNIGL